MRRLSWNYRGLVVAGLVLGLALPAQATSLENRGLFDDGQGGMMNLIYDDDQDLTWLGNANFGAGAMRWQNAVDWAGNLTVGNFTDWRLPTTPQPDDTCLAQGDWGQNFPLQGGHTGCTGSEMGYLFNVEGITSAAPGFFSNVQANSYWSGTDFAPLGNHYAWSFNFNPGPGGSSNPGYQLAFIKGISKFAWAVRDGDVSATAPIPEPGTMLLMGSGLVGLLAWRRFGRG